jgi:predicted SprT family Zn-dependent metalloprotease
MLEGGAVARRGCEDAPHQKTPSHSCQAGCVQSGREEKSVEFEEGEKMKRCKICDRSACALRQIVTIRGAMWVCRSCIDSIVSYAFRHSARSVELLDV